MHAPDCEGLELDLHRLELRYANARLLEPRAVERLARSIEKNGQLMACIGVPDGERVLLIDGYRRIAALRRLGRDSALVERWRCDLAHGLVTVLCRTQGRAFAAIEEALLLRELIDGLGLSQNELARRCGRDVSWVCRRLQLLSGLSDEVLSAVRAGTLSTWSATRVVGPLARANAEHAQRLLASMRAQPLSTRELSCWFEHYQRASHLARERLIGNFEPCCQDPPSFTFASDLMELAFAFDSNPQSTTFSAYLNGALVDSSSFNTVMLSEAPAQGGAGAAR